MKLKLSLFALVCFSVIISSCDDDNSDDPTLVQERDRTEQQAADKDTLQNYFQNHYYNSSVLNALANPSIEDLVITKLAEGETVPQGSTLLSTPGVLDVKTTTHLDVEYEYYILQIREGLGEDQPKFSDKVRVNYEGTLLDATVFDSTSNPTDFDMIYLITAWGRVLPEFKTSNAYIENGDGTASYEGYGFGVMFVPSGLAYYSSFVNGIPSYSSLIFKFELLQTKTNDHDNDYIPSYMEDIDTNLDLNNDDSDANSNPNFLDTDDDGDGTRTYRELGVETYNQSTKAELQEELQALTLADNQFVGPIIYETDGTFTARVITLVDSDNDGMPNYLDPDDSDPVN